LATEQELSDFLKSVERRAFKRSVYHVRDEEAALDIVQDSMMKLAQHYGDKPPEELPMLFQRILSNCTLDWFRRQKTRRALFSNLSDFESVDDDGDFDLLENFDSPTDSRGTESAEDTTRRAQVFHEIEADKGIAGPSTRGFPDALLGGNGRRRDGRRNGLLRGQRQNPLLASRSRSEQGAQGQGNIAMNTKVSTPSSTAAEDEFGQRVTARLSAGNRELPHDIGERLRVARAQAVAARKLPPQLRTAPVVVQSGHTATLGGSWWTRIGSVVPLIALVAGLITISVMQDDDRASELAEVDSALLTGDLPPRPTPTPVSPNS
jgi:hypothetical protein